MKKFLSNLTLNGKLGVLLGALGLVALLGNPYQGSSVTVDSRELARIVQTETDHVGPQELADWIIQGKTNFRLIDLRTQPEFAEYHIPGSENVPLTGLLDHGLLRNEKIILYSEGGIHSAQAWFLLKARGYNGVYMLRGGLEEWRESVLFPTLPGSPTPEQRAAFEKMKEVSTFFGGTPQTGATAERPAVSMTMPKMEMPSPATAPKGATGKKKKEGC